MKVPIRNRFLCSVDENQVELLIVAGLILLFLTLNLIWIKQRLTVR